MGRSLGEVNKRARANFKTYISRAKERRACMCRTGKIRTPIDKAILHAGLSSGNNGNNRNINN